jgi:hypothetical protein
MAGFMPLQDPMVVTQPCNRNGCANVTWGVNFTLPNPSQNGGWVVQEITFTHTETVASGQLVCIPSTTGHFWEAFYIAAGQTTTGTLYGALPNTDDIYRDVHDEFSMGTDTVMGTAKFYEGTLPPDFVYCNAATSAGTRRSTTQQPPGWDGTGTPHNLTLMWDCTAGGDGTYSLQTVPSPACPTGSGGNGGGGGGGGGGDTGTDQQ